MFDRVVRLHVTMHGAETGRALEAFAARSWAARSVAGHSDLLEVDVAITGARSRSVSHAVELLRRECARAGLPVVVRAAWLVSESGPALREYVVFRSRSDTGRPTRRQHKISHGARKALVRLGLNDADALIYAPDLRDAKDELHRRRDEIDKAPRPGRPLAVRRPLHTPTEDTARQNDLVRSDDARLRTGVLASFLAVFLLGAGIGAGGRPPWWATFLIIGFAAPLTAVMAWQWLGTVPALRRSTGAAGLTLLLGILFAAGFWYGRDTGDGAVRRALLTIAAFGFGLGAWHLLRSPLRRTAAWLLPLALSVSVPLAAVLGRITHGAYLGEFDLPVDAVDRDPLADAVAAVEPVALILLSALIVLGLAGWATYFFIEGFIPLAVLAILATSLSGISSAIDTGREEAQRAIAAAQAQENVPSFLGIEPSWVCAQPVNGSIPTTGGRLPTTRPVLWLGDTGDRAALWDPTDETSVRLVLSDAVLLEVPAQTASCPVE
jgi:hypothetical protein